MALTEKIKEIIGVLTDSINPMGGDDIYDRDPDDIETNYETVYPVENTQALKPAFTENAPARSRSKLRVLPQPKNGAHEVVVIEPRAFNESISIVEALKDKKTVILNLQLLDRENSQRIVDFISGCTHALDGSQKKIGDNVFIFTPSNINISQEFVNSRLSSDAIWGTAKS